MVDIIKFKKRYITLTACCETCDTTWVAKVTPSIYEKRQHGMDIKTICPFCNNVDVWFATSDE